MTQTASRYYNELRIYGYDAETKIQLFQLKFPNEPRPKKACKV